MCRLLSLIPAIDQSRWVDRTLAEQGMEALGEGPDQLDGNAYQLVLAISDLKRIAERRTPHADMVELLLRWRNAELAGHYACDLPDETSDAVLEGTAAGVSSVIKEVVARPARCAEDALIKMFMLAVIVLEPQLGDRPFQPVVPALDDPHWGSWPAALWGSICADLPALSPLIAAVQAEPHRDEIRAEARS